MEVDVVTEIEIDRPKHEVAAYAIDPDNATEWYRNIKRVEWESPKEMQVGARIAFEAQFLGRTIAYTYEVKEFVDAQRFVMATRDGPFPMETTYEWSDVATGSTKMTLRNRGAPKGFSRIAAPALALAMRQANTSDLRRLKEILERR